MKRQVTGGNEYAHYTDFLIFLQVSFETLPKICCCYVRSCFCDVCYQALHNEDNKVVIVRSDIREL